MKPNKLKQEAFKILFIIIIILVFAAQYSCSTTGSRTTVAPENRIAVKPDQLQKGTWESRTRNIALEYEFVKEGDTLGILIDGRTRHRIEEVILYLEFVDSKGSILERETVFNSGFRRQGERATRIEGTIERAFEVPEGTKYVAFRSLVRPYTSTGGTRTRDNN